MKSLYAIKKLVVAEYPLRAEIYFHNLAKKTKKKILAKLKVKTVKGVIKKCTSFS